MLLALDHTDISSFGYETKLHSGRPYGVLHLGTAILWNKQLQASTFSNQDNTFIGLTVNLCLFGLTVSCSFYHQFLLYGCCENKGLEQFLLFRSTLFFLFAD